MKKQVTGILMAAVILTASSCSSSKSKGGDGQSKDGRPDVTEIFNQMDSNKDGKLTQAEVSGPLKNDFTTIDSNGDGYITKEELEKAPKPSGQRPQQRQGGQQGRPRGRN